jgi:hypothetical protein
MMYLAFTYPDPLDADTVTYLLDDKPPEGATEEEIADEAEYTLWTYANGTVNLIERGRR